jgi:microcompartment protein CcmL/EutN
MNGAAKAAPLQKLATWREREGAKTVSEIKSIGLIELSSVATGFQVEDTMLKAGNIELLLARSICSGKFLIVVSGDVTSVQAALLAGAAAAGASLIERRQIARVHPSVLAAISNAVDVDPAELRSIGVIETFSAASIIEVADAAVKSANVTLLRVHLAMALGGKGFVLMAGDVSSVQAAVAAGAKVAGDDGMLVGKGVIAAPSRELFREYI